MVLAPTERGFRLAIVSNSARLVETTLGDVDLRQHPVPGQVSGVGGDGFAQRLFGAVALSGLLVDAGGQRQQIHSIRFFRQRCVDPFNGRVVLPGLDVEPGHAADRFEIAWSQFKGFRKRSPCRCVGIAQRLQNSVERVRRSRIRLVAKHYRQLFACALLIVAADQASDQGQTRVHVSGRSEFGLLGVTNRRIVSARQLIQARQLYLGERQPGIQSQRVGVFLDGIIDFALLAVNHAERVVCNRR